MNIKRNIHFSLKTRTYKSIKISENLQIRMRVSYNSDRLDILTGYSIDDDKWDADAQRVKKGYYSKTGESYSDINSQLNKSAYEMDQAFKEFEVIDRLPTKAELLNAYNRRIRGNKVPIKSKKESSFWKAFEQFKSTESVKNSWQYSTIQKFDALANHIKAYNSQPRFDDFDSNGITKFIVVLKDVEDLTNTTILKQLGYLKWFLRWAAVNHFHSVMDFESYKPHLVTSTKKVIFLTIDEIKNLMSAEIPPQKQYLNRVRDIFVFCCFTGLRYSDVLNLKRSDIHDGIIDITTKKTADRLYIELNDVSKRILAKYENEVFQANKALPVISNQKMNEYLEELCKIAGFDEEIRETIYQGNKRMDIVQPKYKLIKTHAGRRSFICNCLAQGIPVNVVMKWTGHSDYKVMKPYIDVADKIKAQEMSKMNNLI